MGRIARQALPVVAMVVIAALVASPADAARIALGVYIPGASVHPGLLDRYAQMTGRRPVVVHSYKDWSSLPFDRPELDSVWNRGAVPLITWEPWTSGGRSFSLRSIAAGRYDGYLRHSAQEAASWGKPLFVSFAQEMNGNWFPWGRDHGNTSRDYRLAWRHVVKLFRAGGATNVRWVWSINEDSGGHFNFRSFYPGDPWVDWVAMDGFNFGAEGWPSFTRIFGGTYDRVAALTSRPLMITETGSTENGGEKAAWISSALESEAPRFSRIRALVWFDKGEPGHNFRINSSSAALGAFRSAIARPEYGATRATLLAAPARITGAPAAPASPEGGYGAPSFLERLWQKLHGVYRWIAAAALLVVLGLAALAVKLLRREHRLRAPA